MSAPTARPVAPTPAAQASERGRPRTLTLRGPISGRIRVRTLVVCAALALAILAAAFLALMIGEKTFAPGRVLSALSGHGSRLESLFIVQWRLPRVVGAIVFGAMLGVSGAIFQTITRNPLGSPDIIGFSAGAYTGGLLVILFVSSGYYAVAGGAVAGGLAVAAIIFALARGGSLQGFRLIVVGIGVTAMLASIDTWFRLTSDVDIALVAATWGVGSLNGLDVEFSGPAMVTGAVFLLVAGLLSRRLAQLDLGDDQATASGSDPGATRVLGIVVGVVLVAIATSATGPIAFVALAAPQSGRRLAGAVGAPMLPAGLVGALILLLADMLAQHAIPGIQLPAGVVTVAVGGVYLLSVIITENKRGTL